MLQCYASVQVQGFQTTCRSNKAQEVTVVSGMLKTEASGGGESQRSRKEVRWWPLLAVALQQITPPLTRLGVKHAKLVISLISIIYAQDQHSHSGQSEWCDSLHFLNIYMCFIAFPCSLMTVETERSEGLESEIGSCLLKRYSHWAGTGRQ